jgi:peptidoglycan/xylan/chitin deacetylase (PgdA/CDA1 family)
MLSQTLSIFIGLGMLSMQTIRQECIPLTVPVEIPILLYHHVAPTDGTDLFTVSPELFREQMHTLVDLGFEAITPQQLTDALQCGVPLPERAVVITFDDGNVDNYDYAFPIMKNLELPGAVYVVANRTASPGYLSVEQLREMIEAGWEIGSHTMTHPDLVGLNAEDMSSELLSSRLMLEVALDVEIKTFAYPYGSSSQTIARKVASYGYNNAMGLGTMTSHWRGNLFYLSRHAVDGREGLDGFIALIDW